MAKYRKKPVEIEAFKLGENAMPDWFSDAVTANIVTLHWTGYSDAHGNNVGYAYINTLEGTHRAEHGDYVIKGVRNELYTCKPDIFEQTYEPSDAERSIQDMNVTVNVEGLNDVVQHAQDMKELANKLKKSIKNISLTM